MAEVIICYSSDEYNNYEFKSKRIWRTDGKYEPFVYIIQEVETEMMYIGSKTQYKGRPCLESWLGTEYFTSSKYIDWRDDEFEICKIIKCASNHDALILERKLICDNGAVWDNCFYNRHEPTVGFNTSGLKTSEETKLKLRNKIVSEETRRKRSEARKGKKFPPDFGQKISKSRTGIEFTDSHKNNLSMAKLGKQLSDTHKKKISEGSKGKIFSDKQKEHMSNFNANLPIVKCPYCYKEGKLGAMKRWHFENCKHKDNQECK